MLVCSGVEDNVRPMLGQYAVGDTRHREVGNGRHELHLRSAIP